MPELPHAFAVTDGTVALRDWHVSDAHALEPVCGDADICTFTSVPWDYSRARAEQWIAGVNERRREGSVFGVAIAGREGAAIVGHVNLVRFSADGREAALGYWLLPQARGLGYATRGARLLSRWGLENLRLTRIELAVLPSNEPSRHVAERLGAEFDGIQPDALQANGQTWDMAIYSLRPDI